VSQVDPAEPVEVAVDSCAARGAEPAGAGTGGAETGGAELGGAVPERLEPGGAESAGAGTGGAELGGAEPKRVESGGAEPECVEVGGAESGGTAPWGAEHARAESGGSPGVPLRREPLSPQRLREWYARRCRRATGAAGAGAAGGAAGAGATGGAAGAGAAGGAAGAGASGGAAGVGAAGGAASAGAAGGAAGARAAGVTGPGGARTGGTGDAGAGGRGPRGGPGRRGHGVHARGGPGSSGAASWGAEPERAEPWGAESGGAEPGVAECGGADPDGAGPGGPSGASSQRELPSPQELREWFSRCWSRAAGAGGVAGAGGSTAAGAAGPGGAPGAGAAGGAGAGGVAGVGAAGGTRAGAAASSGGPAGAGAAGGTGAGGADGAGSPVGDGAGAVGATGGAAGAGGAAVVGADAGGAGAVPAGSGGTARPRPYFVPLLEQVLGLPPSSGPAPSLECPPPVQSESWLQLASPLPAPSPYAGPTGGLAERCEPESRPASPVRAAHTGRRVPQSSLPALTDPESDSLRAASPTVTRLLATVVTDPSFESTAASALVAELVDFAAHCRLDSATSLVAESESVCPPSVGGECALSTDVLEDRQEEFQCFAAALPHLVSMLLAPEGDPDAPDIPTPRTYAEAIEGPYSSQWQSAMDAEMASWKSTGTYVDEVPPPGANIVSGMWIFRVKRQPGSPPVFKARYVARGFSQRQGVDYFHTFSPTPKMTTLRVLLHVAAQRYYDLHSLDFSTAFLQGSLHEEIWLRRPPGFTGSFPADTLRTTLAALGFAPSTADPSLFLRTDTLLPPFYILVYVDDLVFATADTAGLAHVKPELQKRHTCTDLGELRSYLGLQITRDRTRRSITLTQSHMVQQVLQRFDFTYSSPQATPLYTRHSLSALPSDESVEPSGPYPELVGCLILRLEHMAAAKRVLRYLCSTSGMGLVLRGRSPVVLTSHADASWLNLWPRVSLLETSPTLRWTGKVGDASVFWVWGSHALVRDTSADKLSTRTIPCDCLGFSPNVPGWQFYHPTSRRVFPSQDVTFDESVPFYRLFPYLFAPLPSPPLFLAPVPPPIDPLPPKGPSPSAVDSGAAPDAASGGEESEGARSGGAELGVEDSEGAGYRGAEPWGAERGGAEPTRVEPGGTTSGGAELRGTASSGDPAGAPRRLSPRPEPLSPQRLREWFAQHTRLRSGGTGAEDSVVGDTGAGGDGVWGAGGTGAGGTVRP
ncbi:unnamed protein product, partial [Closterium sp. NIES-54]